MGDFSEVPVLEVFISVGEEVTGETSLLSLESAKAVTDIPAGFTGTVVSILVGEGDIVSEGAPIAEIEVAEVVVPEKKAPVKEKEPEKIVSVEPIPEKALKGTYHATPSIRQYARNKGLPLDSVIATGPHGRILKEDIDLLLQNKVPTQQSSRPEKDERITLSRIQKLSGPHILNSWQSIPHVTQFDEADVTELEQFRSSLKNEFS